MTLQSSAMKDMYVARASDIAARMLGGCVMIMSPRDSSLFSLNEVGSLIWNAADGSMPLANIAENIICAEFDVAPAQALADAEEFVSKLVEHGILKISEQAVPAVSQLEQP